MKMVRAEPESWARVMGEWGTLMAPEDGALMDDPYVRHANEIVTKRSDPNYWISLLVEEEGTVAAFSHFNWAFPHSSTRVLRCTWSSLSPKLLAEDTPDEKLAEILRALSRGAIEIAKEKPSFEEIKILLNNLADTRFARGFALAMAGEGSFRVAVRGSWLHIEPIVGRNGENG